jgi:hypothetical protein
MSLFQPSLWSPHLFEPEPVDPVGSGAPISDTRPFGSRLSFCGCRAHSIVYPVKTFDWKSAMNQFAILFGERFTQAL